MLSVELIPCRTDNYAYLLRDSQTGAVGGAAAGDPVVVAESANQLREAIGDRHGETAQHCPLDHQCHARHEQDDDDAEKHTSDGDPDVGDNDGRMTEHRPGRQEAEAPRDDPPGGASRIDGVVEKRARLSAVARRRPTALRLRSRHGRPS